jgi:hypothetical protein
MLGLVRVPCPAHVVPCLMTYDYDRSLRSWRRTEEAGCYSCRTVPTQQTDATAARRDGGGGSHSGRVSSAVGCCQGRRSAIWGTRVGSCS